MNKKRLIMALCYLFLFVIASIPAQAGFYIGVRGGRSSQDVQGGDIKFDQDSSFLYGGQVGFKLLSFAVEGQFYRAGHDLITADSRFTKASQILDYHYLGVSGKLGFPLVVVFPYITVGYGTYSVSLDEIGKDSRTAFNIGAGAELSLGKIAVFAELRYTDFSLEIENQNWDFGGLDIHAGLNIHF
jgi:opacity protein-like surface antigen